MNQSAVRCMHVYVNVYIEFEFLYSVVCVYVYRDVSSVIDMWIQHSNMFFVYVIIRKL